MCLRVSGAWSCWSPWSQCSVSCGGGHYQRTRMCSNPPPAGGGNICVGLHTEEALCNTHSCNGKTVFCFVCFFMWNRLACSQSQNVGGTEKSPLFVGTKLRGPVQTTEQCFPAGFWNPGERKIGRDLLFMRRWRQEGRVCHVSFRVYHLWTWQSVAALMTLNFMLHSSWNR